MSIGIYFLLLCSMFAVSTSPLIARYLHHLDPVAIAFWRMIIGALIMHTFSLTSSGKKSLSKKTQLEHYLLVFCWGYILLFFMVQFHYFQIILLMLQYLEL